MMKEIREQEPFIHFGFSRQELKTHVGFPIVIWQDNIYKEDEYTTPYLLAPSGDVKQDSINKYEVSFTSLGTKNCQLSFIGIGVKGLQSNQIVVEVEAITWGSKDVFLNNTEIIFNAI